MLLYSTTRLFALSALLLILSSIAQGITMALILTLLLTWSPPEMRGRVAGTRVLAIGTLPLGNLIAGAGTSLWGAPIMIAIDASAAITLIALITLWVPELRQHRQSEF